MSDPHPRLTWALRILLAITVGLIGGWLGMEAWGDETVWMGPLQVRLESEIGSGVTEIGLPPVGRLTADTHTSPLRLKATLQDIRVAELTKEFGALPTQALVDEVQREALARVAPFALRVFVAGMGGALLLALLVYRRRWRRIVTAVSAALVLVGGLELVTWRTFRAEAFLSPRFSGTLALAPDFVGPVEEASDRIDAFRAELDRVVTGAVRVFTRFQTSGLGEGNEIRVLHISDVHLLPLGLEFAREVAESFDVDFVLDTGDLTSFGTPAEEAILDQIPGFNRPYVFVRGNHDAPSLAEAMREVPNVIVLDGTTGSVSGVTLYGLGHPVFTREENPAVEDFATQSRAVGDMILSDLERLETPPDIVAVHDDRMAEAVAGLVPLVVSGHYHAPSARVVNGTVYLRVGSTGGTGETVFTEPGGFPLSAEILYFSADDQTRLLAFDLIEQMPATGSLTVERHLASDLVDGTIPLPTPSVTGDDGGPEVVDPIAGAGMPGDPRVTW